MCKLKNSNDETHYDAIVIGSGLGGLSTAALLSKILKKRVLVLERHFEPGGLTHEFKRGPYSWDVGLHYVGDLTTRPLDIVGYKLFNYLSNGKLKWNKMPELFEKFIYPDFSIEIKKSLKGFRQSLYKQFPDDKKDINRYISDVHKARLWYLAYFFANFLHSPFKDIMNLIKKIFHSYSAMTTEEYLKKNIKNEKLRSVLSIRWGNYGVPPHESSFAVHAITEHHYFPGGMFPDGGAEKICTTFEQSIEESGGKILVNRETQEILLKDNTAIGVRVKNISNKDNIITDYFAPIIISAVGAKNTYLKLLPDLNLPIQNQLKTYTKGYSALDLYLGLKESPEKLGLHGANQWISDSYELDCFDKEPQNQLNGEATYCFLSFPSLKSGTKSNHTADVVTIFPHSYFEKWSHENWKERGNDYYTMKEKLTESLLKLIEKRIPGFNDLIVYKEMATPLTFEHFTNKADGAFYGLPSTPDRYKLDLQVKTPIKNLYLSGTDIICNGILPALNSGMATVSYLMGTFGIFQLMNKVFAFKPKKIKNPPYFTKDQKTNEDKREGILINKVFKDNLVELTFQFDQTLRFIGGQHIKLYVDNSEWRAYSVAKIDNTTLTLIIDTRPKGHGAGYAKNMTIGEKSIFRFPITDLVYHESNRDLLFIATGTGLIPFLHILDELKKENIKKNCTVLFGCMTDTENFADHYLAGYKDFFNIKTEIFVEKPIENSTFNKGRVTDFINKPAFNPQSFDIYICGHPHMTENTVKLLRSKGADKLYY
ncbi:MAG TPA: hypothetical protein DDY71_05960 [Spirochaetia bacterium]|nr:hypothetical protein [Spirochaetia bacterium]HBI37172.1 hypothetical protein [Spirochaetia bacterium]